MTLLMNAEEQFNRAILDLSQKPIQLRLLLAFSGVIVFILFFLLLHTTSIPSPVFVALGFLWLTLASLIVGLKWSVPLTVTMVVAVGVLLRATDRVPPTLDYPGGMIVPGLVFAMFGIIGGSVGTILSQLRQEQEATQKMIVARDEIAQSLRESEARYRKMVEEISDVMYVTDVRGYFTYVSPAAYRLTGHAETDLIGMHFTKLIRDDWRERSLAHYQRQFSTKQEETLYQFPIITTGGEEKWVEQTVALMTDDNTITGFQSIVRDITARKHIEFELEKARDEALDALSFKAQIIANISHDARTPLGAIMLVTEMLQDELYGPLTFEQREQLNTILASANQLLSFINNLLDASQLNRGEIRLRIKEFTPFELVGQADRVLKPLVEKKGLVWHSQVADDVPEMLQGDLDRLRQILFHLAGNAIKFTKQGQITVRMFRPDAAHWALEVSDTGIGIPDDAQNSIFDTFWQVDGSRTSSVQTGIGLGLAIVRRLVELMHGQIHVASEPGEGSKFTIVLPLEPVLQPE